MIDVSEIQKMFEAGLTVEAIADELGVTTAKVKTLLKVIEGGSPKKHDNEDAIVEAYTSQEDVPDILRKYKISYSKLYAILHRQNIPLRKSTESVHANQRLDRAIQMYEAGDPLWKIKSETGVHQPTLHSALHERGISLRRPR